MKILQITACGPESGYVYGLGDDNKVYEWSDGEWVEANL